jgi:hypothetical protein
VRADLLRVSSEADGPVESFGSRFWTSVLASKPEIGQLVRNGTPTQVVYQDRYLFSPLTQNAPGAERADFPAARLGGRTAPRLRSPSPRRSARFHLPIGNPAAPRAVPRPDAADPVEGRRQRGASGSRIGLSDSAAAAVISVCGAAGSSGRRIGLGFVSTSFIGRLSQCRSSFWMFGSATRLECER